MGGCLPERAGRGDDEELCGAGWNGARAVWARLLVSPESAVTAHEAGLKQMTVLVEFDSYAMALAAYESADYKKALAALGSGAERNFRIAEGV